MNTKTTSVQPKVVIQSMLCPALTPVSANKNFEKFKQVIENTDRILIDAGLEDLAIRLALENLEKNTPEASEAVRRRHPNKAIKG